MKIDAFKILINKLFNNKTIKNGWKDTESYRSFVHYDVR